MSGARDAEQVLAEVSDIVRNFNGREYSGEIGPHTRFFADLGMVSIDAVVLAETLEGYYGQTFPFNEFLAEIGAREQRDLELGELTAFLHKHLR
jgi:acyl carrier protein